MNITRLKKDLEAVKLTLKFEPIIEAIKNRSDGVDPMTAEERMEWIKRFALKANGNGYLFVEDFVNGNVRIPNNAMALDTDSLGRKLLEEFSANDIFSACTYYSLAIDTELRGINVVGNPPILKDLFKIDKNQVTFGTRYQADYPFIDEEYKGANITTFEYGNVKAQSIGPNTSRYVDDLPAIPDTLVGSVKELDKILKRETELSISVGREIADIYQAGVFKIDISPQDILDSFMLYHEQGSMSFDAEVVEEAYPFKFILGDESVIVPNCIFKFMKELCQTLRDDQKAKFRFHPLSDGYIVDASSIASEAQDIEIDGEVREVFIKRIIDRSCFIFKDFDDYPNLFMTFQEDDIKANPPTIEEVAQASIQTLTLDNFTLIRQMKVNYKGQKVPMSVASLDKWSKSDKSYGAAMEIINEHLDYYTIVDDNGIRANNGAIYEATKNAVAERVKSLPKAVQQSTFEQTLSKYAFTIEETFFNLNDDFSNPEKVLGYFLGMGTEPNTLFLGQANPYRNLCARLLGIDYALQYNSLCKSSCLAGYLFIHSFENDKPIFVNADVFLEGNFYDIEDRVLSETFQKEVSDFFGNDETAKEVIESHLKLLAAHAPKFMKFQHGEIEEYERLVRRNGIGAAYSSPDNRMEEVTRLTATLGLLPTSNSSSNYSSRGDRPSVINYLEDLPSPYKFKPTEGYSQAIDNAVEKAKRFVARASKMAGKDFSERYNKDNIGQQVVTRKMGDYFYEYNRRTGKDLYGRASDAIRYNALSKSDAIRNFYAAPKSENAGGKEVLSNGVTFTNKELGENDQEREVRVLYVPFSSKGTLRKRVDKKMTYPYVTKGIMESQKEGRGMALSLENMGYDLSDKNVVAQIAQILTTRAIGIFHEISSQARIEGDELLSFAMATERDKREQAQMAMYEVFWNYKYNNFATKASSQVPIFLENMRHFGDISRFVQDATQSDGRPAGFSLRQAQKDGLKFLGASGNSGLLAHEVGFGKTTSAIAKVSDLFLRGDAKRVLICVPNPVYQSGNWEEEIQGAVNSVDNRKITNGLLPSNITLVKLGAMNFKDLLGTPLKEGTAEYLQKSEGNGYSGPIFYSDVEIELIEKFNAIAQELNKRIGGAKKKYGKFEGSMLSRREQTYNKPDNPKTWINENPFFNRGQQLEKNQVIRFNNQKPNDLTAFGNSILTLNYDDYDFWDYNSGEEYEFGTASDIVTGVTKDSFLKDFVTTLQREVKGLQFDEKGGDIRTIYNQLISIHDKYLTQYEAINNLVNNRTLPEGTESNDFFVTKRRNAVTTFGGAFGLDKGVATKLEKKGIPRSNFYGGSGPSMEIGVAPYTSYRLFDKLSDPEKAKQGGYWPFFGTRSFYERVIVPYHTKRHAKKPYSTWQELRDDMREKFPITDFSFGDALGSPPPEIQHLALNEIRTALELQMTEEIAFFLDNLRKQAPLFLGTMKEWASKPNSIVLCSHLAVGKLSVARRFGEESVRFMKGVSMEMGQMVHYRATHPNYKKTAQNFEADATDNRFDDNIFTPSQRAKLFLSEYRGFDLNRLSCDAFIVDEIHNFNKAFSQVAKGTSMPDQIRTGAGDYNYDAQKNAKVQRILIQGRAGSDVEQLIFDTSANYDLRADVQNFIAVSLYFQDRGQKIAINQKRKIENTIFLSATPFTDDNFQMLSLFGTMSLDKLRQAHIFNTFDFFQLYAKERWSKDIDYKNNYTLFPKIVGYKNIYSLSQLIRAYTNFKISDEEINANRPEKVILGTDAPKLKGITPKEQEGLSKAISQVPFSEAQEKMNRDLEKFVTLDSDSQLQYTQADLLKAEKIYKKLQKKKGEGNPEVDELVEQIMGIVKITKKGKNKPDLIEWEGAREAIELEPLADRLLELEPTNKLGLNLRSALDDEFIQEVEGEEGAAKQEEVDDKEILSANAVNSEGADESVAQRMSRRALQASMQQQFNLITPYYSTINADKNLMNPYLPPLDGTPSQNAKRVVENSPKLLYACKAVVEVLKYAIDEKGQTYMGSNEQEEIMGQVIFLRNYNFTYHGKGFYIFDLMKQYLIDENKALFERIVEDSGFDVDQLFASIDGRTRKVKDASGEVIDEKTLIVERFNKGQILVLFGTEIIKEGINLQKNCPIMYILQVGFVPVVYMQLHGRVWRQKNPYQYAFLINVLTQNSIDAFTYSKLEQKIQAVKQMLEGDVYDAEETQFDVDVEGIKERLINDPAKLAEIKWDDLQSTLSRRVDTLTEEIPLIRDLESTYPQARDKYQELIDRMNLYSSLVDDMEVSLNARLYANWSARGKLNRDAKKEADKAYKAQFSDDKIKTAFEENPYKFTNKDGSPKYLEYDEIFQEKRKVLKGRPAYQPISDEDARKKYLELRFQGNKEFRDFGVDTTFDGAFNFTNITPILSVKQQLPKLTPRYPRVVDDKLILGIVENAIPDPTNVEKVVEALGEFANYQKVYQAENAIATAVVYYMESQITLNSLEPLITIATETTESFDEDGNKVTDTKTGFTIAEAVDRDQSGGLFTSGYSRFEKALRDSADLETISRNINAFNDIISNRQIETEDGNKRDADLSDIPIILEQTERELENAQSKLDNRDQTIQELTAQAAEEIRAREGEITPDVDARVNDLKAIFPYLNRATR